MRADEGGGGRGVFVRTGAARPHRFRVDVESVGAFEQGGPPLEPLDDVFEVWSLPSELMDILVEVTNLGLEL